MGAHVGEATSDKDKTVAPSNSSSIGANISGVTTTVVSSPQCIQENLVSHPFNNPIWDQTNLCYVLVNAINSAEGLAGAHFTDQEYDNHTDQEYDNCR